jgi:hypothetical protein
MRYDGPMAIHDPLILIALLLGLLLIAGLLKTARPRTDVHGRKWPLEAKGPVLTDAERARCTADWLKPCRVH